jgi:hypothetical protein
MKVDIQLRTFLIPALERRKWPVSDHGWFASNTHWVEDWIDLREDTDRYEKRNIFFFLPGVESRILVCPTRRIFTTPSATAMRIIIGRLLKTITKYITNNVSNIKKELHHRPSNSSKIGTSVLHKTVDSVQWNYYPCYISGSLDIAYQKFCFCEVTKYFIFSLENCSYRIV